MSSLFARLQVWFYRYFIGYGEYRYSPSDRYYRSRRARPRPTLRAVGTRADGLAVDRATHRRPSRGVA